jgi:hypothetical protein
VVDEQEYHRDISRIVRLVLTSLRMSVEDALPAQHNRGGSNSSDRLIHLSLELESARLKSYGVSRGRGTPVNLELSYLLKKIRESRTYANVLPNIKFRLVRSSPEEKSYIRFSERFDGRDLSVEQAVAILEDLLVESPGPLFEAVLTLRHIVPDQKIAPVQFDISNNKIIVSRRKSPL